MSKLYFIPVKGPAEEVTVLDEELEYGAPKFDIMRRGLQCSTIEHISTNYQNKAVHLFIDEDGHAKSLPPNPRATALYANKHLRMGSKGEMLRYNDLSEEPVPPIVHYRTTGCLIVGPCYMWTGEPE